MWRPCRAAPTWAVVLSAVMLVGGCGGSTTDESSSSSTTSTGSPAVTGPQTAPGFVGLTKSAAIARAEAEGHHWRIAREDGQHYLLTQDYSPDRVNFEIDGGKVTAATFG